jgi:general secretion pathway protein M
VFIGAGIIVMLALVYLLAVEPFFKQRTILTQRIKAQRQELVWMQQNSERVKRLQAASPDHTQTSYSRSLLGVVDSSSRTNNMRKSIQRMEPEGNNGVKLWIEDADFDTLIQWLGSLNTQQSVYVARATISRGDAPGLIDTRLSLQRP